MTVTNNDSFFDLINKAFDNTSPTVNEVIVGVRTMLIGNVTFRRDGCGITYNIPTEQWDLEPLKRDLTARLKA